VVFNKQESGEGCPYNELGGNSKVQIIATNIMDGFAIYKPLPE
jgi:hypothetical protein